MSSISGTSPSVSKVRHTLWQTSTHSDQLIGHPGLHKEHLQLSQLLMTNSPEPSSGAVQLWIPCCRIDISYAFQFHLASQQPDFYFVEFQKQKHKYEWERITCIPLKHRLRCTGSILYPDMSNCSAFWKATWNLTWISVLVFGWNLYFQSLGIWSLNMHFNVQAYSMYSLFSSTAQTKL